MDRVVLQSYVFVIHLAAPKHLWLLVTDASCFAFETNDSIIVLYITAFMTNSKKSYLQKFPSLSKMIPRYVLLTDGS